MKTEVKKLDATKREISIEASGETVEKNFTAAFKKIGDQAKVPGFRPGHVPHDILEKRFSASAHQMVLETLIPELYHQAVEKEGLQVVGQPEISEVKLDQNTITFLAQVEVIPEFRLKEYRGLKINYKKIEVSPEEIKRSLDSLKEMHRAEVIDDSFARSLGYFSLAELKQAAEKQLFLQMDNQQHRRIENEIIESLLKDLDLKLPQALVKRRLEELLRQAKLDLTLRGLPREKIDEEDKTITQQLEPEARKQVKIYLVLSAIAKKEAIPLDDNMTQRVIELILKEAQWTEVSD